MSNLSLFYSSYTREQLSYVKLNNETTATIKRLKDEIQNAQTRANNADQYVYIIAFRSEPIY
jgi:hypothetical protein